MKKRERAITADKMVLNIKPKMTRAQAEQVLALSKVYSKKAFPDGMLEEAVKIVQNND